MYFKEGYHEQNVYSITGNRFGLNTKYIHKINYFNPKHIDPQELHEISNSVNTAIQFTMEFSDNNLPFLYILINKQGSRIWINIYSEPVDWNRYVPFNSNHWKRCFKNILFCLAQRICTIVENAKIRKPNSLKFNFNCEGLNLIYVVICYGCQEEYMGQTNTLSE